jgi:hypothetical protein
MPYSTQNSISRTSMEKFSSPFLGRSNLYEGQEAHTINQLAPSQQPQEKIPNPSDPKPDKGKSQTNSTSRKDLVRDLKKTISVNVDDINHRFRTPKLLKMDTDLSGSKLSEDPMETFRFRSKKGTDESIRQTSDHRPKNSEQKNSEQGKRRSTQITSEKMIQKINQRMSVPGVDLAIPLEEDSPVSKKSVSLRTETRQGLGDSVSEQ